MPNKIFSKFLLNLLQFNVSDNVILKSQDILKIFIFLDFIESISPILLRAA